MLILARMLTLAPNVAVVTQRQQQRKWLILTALRLKVGRFDGQASWEVFKAKFEVVAATNRWSTTERAVQLAISLEGEAQRVLLELSEQEIQDPQAIATAIALQFGQPVPAVVKASKVC